MKKYINKKLVFCIVFCLMSLLISVCGSSLNSNKIENNSSISTIKDYNEIAKKLLDKVIFDLKTSDIYSLDKNIYEDIENKDDINYILSSYSNVKVLLDKYFSNFHYKINSIDKKNNNEFDVNLTFTIIDELQIVLKVMPKIISKTLFNIKSISKEDINDMILLFADNIDDTIRKKEVKCSLTIVKKDGVYKIKTIDKLIENIQNTIEYIFDKFN